MARKDEVPGGTQMEHAGVEPTPEASAFLQANARLNAAVAAVMDLEVKLRQARADERRARKDVADATARLGGY